MTDTVAEAMSAEFDTMAWWTAQVVSDQGGEYAIPAGCRGSGCPSWLDWLIDSLRITADDVMLDVGAGVGGPAEYAARRTGVRPTLVDPEGGACRAARTLFHARVVQAEAAALPFAAARFDVVWSLGVLCTTPDDVVKLALLRELRRITTRQGRVGLLVLEATTDTLQDPPEGNHFPTVTSLPPLLAHAGFAIKDRVDTSCLDDPPEEWVRQAGAVDKEMAQRFAGSEAWQTAQRQSGRIAEMLRDGQLITTLLHLAVDDRGQGAAPE